MVTRLVLLDSGPLGLVTNTKPSPRNLACSAWLQSLIEAGVHVIVPEIADYEVRRELLRANKVNGLAFAIDIAGSLVFGKWERLEWVHRVQSALVIAPARQVPVMEIQR